MASCVPTASITEWAPSPPVSSLTVATPSSPRSSTMSVAPNSRGQRLPVGVTAEGDDPLGAQLLRGQDAEQADRAVTHHSDRLARPRLGRDRGEPAGAEHVGGRHERGDQVGLGHAGRGDEGAVGERDARQLGLGPDGAHQHAVNAVGLVAGPADLARVVGGPEGAHHEVPDLDGADLVADLLDHTDVLVAHHLVLDRLGAAVGPQVADPQMQVALSRMIASVGSMIVGSSRSSTRTSPGACMTTWRMALGSSSRGGSCWSASSCRLLE